MGSESYPLVPSGGSGDALVANPLSQFAATTSAQLAGVISDETGSGAAVFATSPTLVTPALGTPSSGVLTNCTGLPLAGMADLTGPTVIGKDSGTGVPIALTPAQIYAIITGQLPLRYVATGTAGSAVATLGFSSLGILQGEIGVAFYDWKRAGAGTLDLSILVDNDLTQANYSRQSLIGATSAATASSSTSASLVANTAVSTNAWGIVLFTRDTSGYFSYIAVDSRGLGQSLRITSGYHETVNAATINDLDFDIVTGVAGLDTGSYIKIFKVVNA